MEPRTIMASTFKQQCLALLDQVAITGVTVIVTKRGRPVAQVTPIPHDDGHPTMGSVQLLADGDEPYLSTGVSWEADARSL